MTLERIESWEFIDEAEYGGVVLVSGIFSCSQCGRAAERETLHLRGFDTSTVQTSGELLVNLDAADDDSATGSR
jgi:hypothetical protein